MPLSDADNELLELQRSALTTGMSPGGQVGDAARDPENQATWEARRAAQREAYGQFVAAGPIHIGNCLAFDTGHPVPLEHVIRYDLEALDLVHRVGTPEMARLGKRFETEEEFLAANPTLAKARAAAAPLSAAALDPRGGAAALDDERQAAAAKAKKPTGRSGGPSAGQEN
jgi:hypothetical protein